ncbi:MAG: membrane protein insertase YidC [Deltaproteobacteria bacterium]|jgi:YidC/Oxa1 family membrane protein insertase|nr:membrane protein insertase YidC [Deltaproteobacteria bacterium]
MNNNKKKSDKFLACLLVSVLFLMYLQTVFYPFFYPEKYASKAVQNSKITTESLPVAPLPQVQPVAETGGLDYKITTQMLEQAGSVKVETDILKAEISLLGGRLKNLELKAYKETVAADSPLMNLINQRAGMPLPLAVYQAAQSDEVVKYELIFINQPKKEGEIYQLGNADEIKFTLQGALANGQIITKTFSFKRDCYLFDLNYTVDGSSEPTKLEWTRYISEEDSKTNVDSEFVWFTGAKVRRESFANLKAEAQNRHNLLGGEVAVQKKVPDTNKYKEDLRIKWLAMGELYFNEILIADTELQTGEIVVVENLYSIRLISDKPNATYRVFVGPKKYDLLKQAGDSLEKNINLGKMGFFPAGLVSLIATPMMLLLNMLYKLFGNYGVAIIGLTILVKLITFPVNMSSLKHMKIMADLQPEVKVIQERMKETKDPNALMEFYKKKGVNPMGGCLPAFIQIPFFIGLYAALYCAFELRHAPFALWIKDLSASEELLVVGFPVPVLVVLFTVFMLVQQWLTPTMGDPTQKKVMLLMPIFFGFILANLPAGLTLYMLVSSVISVAQQKVYNRTSSTRDALIADISCSVALLCLGLIFTKIH